MPEYVLEESDKESNDIVAYDTETSHYMTVANRDQREKRDRCCADPGH